MEKKNKFVIITPSYNNEEWVEPNLTTVQQIIHLKKLIILLKMIKDLL
jgi:hypothetical protein